MSQRRHVWNVVPTAPDAAYYIRISSDSDAGALFHPTNLTIGPWGHDAQHGGPPSALFAHHLRRDMTPRGLLLAKLSVQLYRPIPTRSPIRLLPPTTLFESRSVRILESRMVDPQDASRVYARAEAVGILNVDTRDSLLRSLIGTAETVDAETFGVVDLIARHRPPPPPPPSSSQTWDNAQSVPTYFHTISWDFSLGGSFPQNRPSPKTLDEVRASLGVQTVRGRVKDSVALFIDDATGERHGLDMVECIMAIGDAGSGISAVLPWGKFLFSNIDYSVSFLTHETPDPPRADDDDGASASPSWVVLRSKSRVNGSGYGMTESDFFDGVGRRVAFGSQTLVVKKVPGANEVVLPRRSSKL